MIVVFIAMWPLAAPAATYYVSNDGSDANEGLSQESPWQTIDAVNAATASGDSVLFERSGLFRGQVNINGTDMTWSLWRWRTDGHRAIEFNLTAEGMTVRANAIGDTGYNAIFTGRGGNIIEGNVIRRWLAVINDGGAIAVFSDGNTVRNNFLERFKKL
jgi:hypothetical protein